MQAARVLSGAAAVRHALIARPLVPAASLAASRSLYGLPGLRAPAGRWISLKPASFPNPPALLATGPVLLRHQDLPSVRDLWAARRLRSTWHESSSSVQRRRSSDPKPASWKPPPRRESAFEYLDRYPSYLIWGIIAISGAVFLAWQYAIQSAQRFGDWKALRFMRMNFLCDWNGVVGAKRVWTLLTSTFSHNEMWHFGINMFVLHSFGSTVIQTIGSRLFLQLYLLSGVASSCAGLVYYRLFDRRSNAPSHGASGSITAITAVFASIYPTATIFVWFIPMPAWAAVAGLVGMDVYRAASGTSGRTNTAAHIGGALTGLAYFFIRIKPYLRPL